jgi:hypothetical protein
MSSISAGDIQLLLLGNKGYQGVATIIAMAYLSADLFDTIIGFQLTVHLLSTSHHCYPVVLQPLVLLQLQHRPC